MNLSSRQPCWSRRAIFVFLCLNVVAILAFSGCRGVQETAPAPSSDGDYRQPDKAVSSPGRTSFPEWRARAVDYDQLPGWRTAELVPGLLALKRSCALFANRDSRTLLATRVPFAGKASDWRPACAALEVADDRESARMVIEALFTPLEIIVPDRKPAIFTGYFEPTYEARHAPVPPFTEPVPARPDDLVSRSGAVYQVLRDGRRRPYPARADIVRNGVRPLAWAHPADVFFLQIQGSGRLVFPDGRTVRAVYAGHNGRPFRSAVNWMQKQGWITRGEMNMKGVRAWMDRATPAQILKAMNTNPRFVFFDLLPEGDPASGPKGSLGVPLTPLGSVAVDLQHHAGGIPMFIQTSAPGLGGEWSGLVVAQDTGGAIIGPGRVDLYFGTGFEAGEAADTLNAPGRIWLLLPRALAARMN